MKHLIWLLSLCMMLTINVLPAANARSNVDFEISKASFFEEGLAPVRKPASYDLTIVYFMDYQCPACRKYTPDLARVLDEDPRIRLIYRDTPLLGPRSDKAALAAIASSFQGRHEAFHHAMMTTKGPLDDRAIKAAADKAGVNWPRLQRDMISRREDIDLQIARNFELATDIGIAGTPAFIIGNRQSNGALDYRALKLEIADARSELGVGKAPPFSSGQSDVGTRAPAGQAPSEQGGNDGPQEPPPVAAVSAAEPEPAGSAAIATSQQGDVWKWPAGLLLGLMALGLIWGAVRKLSSNRIKPR